MYIPLPPHPALHDQQDGTESLPLLFDVPRMPRDSIKYMMSGCDLMLHEIEKEMGNVHMVMQASEQRLTLFDSVPHVKEQLGKTWERFVTDEKK